MDLVLLELICWGGLLFFFWALKDGLSKVEADIESLGLLNNVRKAIPGRKGISFHKPEAVSELIGSYGDSPIYQFAVIDGQTYQFDRVFSPGNEGFLDSDERCIAPGLVYLACKNIQQPLTQT